MKKLMNSFLVLGVIKKLIILFLVLGVVFAAGSFPPQISGTDLLLFESHGNTTDGDAVYANEAQTAFVGIVMEPMSSEQWESGKSVYDEYGWSTKTEEGIEYYYHCESVFEESYCFVDFYKNEIYYMMDVYLLEGSNSEAIELGIKVGKQISGGEEMSEICSCPVALVLLGLTLVGLSRIN